MVGDIYWGKVEAVLPGLQAAFVDIGTDKSAFLHNSDLAYDEDSRAEVDFNVVGTDAGAYVELQGTAEGKPCDRPSLDALLDLANVGLGRLFEAQSAALAKVRR